MKTKSFLFACVFAAAFAASMDAQSSPKIITVAGAEGTQVVLLPSDQKLSDAITTRKVAPMFVIGKESAPSLGTKSAKFGFAKTGAGNLEKSTSVQLAKSMPGPLTKSTFVLRLAKSGTTAPSFGSPSGAKASAAKGGTTSLALAPGRSLVLGPTAGATLVSTAVPAPGTDTIVVTARRNSATALGAGPLSATIQRQVFVGDLVRTTPRADDSSTGSAFAPGVALVTGPNGFPVPVTAAAQSGTNPIGPNGFPSAAPFAQTGLTRAGTSRDTTVPATRAPSAAGAVSVGMVGAPGAAFSAPATLAPASGPTISTASPR